MKFHVTKDLNLKPVDFVIQVGAPIARAKYTAPAGCQCAQVFPVKMKSVGLDALRSGAHCDAQKYICLCNGEIVR